MVPYIQSEEACVPMNSKNNNTTLIMFAVLAAFGLVMATSAVLPVIQQAHALTVIHGPPCFKVPGPDSHPPQCRA